MDNPFQWFVGLDWASALHRVCVLDAQGKRVAERDVAHSGAALAEMCAWLCEVTGAAPEEIAVAIETPRGLRPWEHAIRDDADLERHIDYIHFNPVKHGLVSRVCDLPHSSFKQYVARGDLLPDWGGDARNLTSECGE